LLQNQIADYYLMLGAVYGLTQGMYWSSMHTFTTEALGGKRMGGFVAWHVVLASFNRAVFPFTLGAIIQFVSFGTAVLIMLCIAAVLLSFTFVMREQRKSGGAGMSMRRFFAHVREKKLSRRMWSQFFIQMMFPLQMTATVCITILIVLQFDNDFSLGALTSVFALVAILTMTLYKSIKSPRFKLCFYYVASMIPLVCAVALLFGVSNVTIILCQAGFVGFRMVSGSELDKTRMNLMSDIGAEHLHTEGLLFIESGYFIARMAVCSLIVLAFSLGIFFFQVLVVALVATVPLSAVLLHLWTRKFAPRQA
jgi:YQGE family putative transporter